MKKTNNLFIIAFILISLLIGVWIVRVLGSRYIIMISNIDIFMLFIRITSYVNIILSVLFIINLVIIFVLVYKQKYRKSIVVMNAINIILAVLIQIIKYGLGIYIQQVVNNKPEIPFGYTSMSMFVSTISFVQFCVILIMYLAIIIMMIFSFTKVKMDDKSMDLKI